MPHSQAKQKIAAQTKRHNVGAYSQPFSGVGIEFEPLGTPAADTGLTLHETGYLAKLQAWNFPNVYSPFWRIYFDYEKGHHVRFGDKLTTLDAHHARPLCAADPHPRSVPDADR